MKDQPWGFPKFQSTHLAQALDSSAFHALRLHYRVQLQQPVQLTPSTRLDPVTHEGPAS